MELSLFQSTGGSSLFSSIQSPSCVRLFVTPGTAACQAAVHVHHQLLELAQTHVHQVGDAIQPSRSVLSPSPPAFSLHQCLF